MEPIETTEQGQSGCGRTSATRRDGACGKVSPAETDPDSGCGPSRGVSGPEAAAHVRIGMPMD